MTRRLWIASPLGRDWLWDMDRQRWFVLSVNGGLFRQDRRGHWRRIG